MQFRTINELYEHVREQALKDVEQLIKEGKVVKKVSRTPFGPERSEEVRAA